VPKGKPKDGTPVHVRFHLGPDIEIMPTDNVQTTLLRLADGSNWAFAAAGGALSVDESLWVDEEGRPHPTRQLVIEAPTGKGGLTFSWQLRHIG
jgi:uncharacterized heparinase superfamily protein